jgi:hypothetical protein
LQDEILPEESQLNRFGAHVSLKSSGLDKLELHFRAGLTSNEVRLPPEVYVKNVLIQSHL